MVEIMLLRGNKKAPRKSRSSTRRDTYRGIDAIFTSFFFMTAKWWFCFDSLVRKFIILFQGDL